MALNINWNNFTAFQDGAVLSRTIFTANRPDFFQWINNLRAGINTAPNHCGIPAARVPDVLALLNAFFPNVTRGAVQRVEPVKIRYNAGTPPTPNPVPVQFGSAGINIIDGPSALGYIFSISAPVPTVPPTVLTYQNYGLPLLAIYSRCLYLAYCKDSVTSRATPSNVPWMTCIMYLSGSQPFRCLLGSTYITHDSAATDGGTLGDGLRRMMNGWRRQRVIDVGLNTFHPPRTLPPIAPKLIDSAGTAIFRAFQGQSIAQPGCTINRFDANGPIAPAQRYIFRPVVPQGQADQFFRDRQAQFLNIRGVGGGQVRYRTRDKLGISPLYDQTIATLMRAIVLARWDPAYATHNRDTPQIRAALRALFRFYFVPHNFPQYRNTAYPDMNQPEIILPGYDAAIQGSLDTFFGNYRVATLDMLDQVYWWINFGNNFLDLAGPDTPIFGRCAETYPVVGLLPGWTHERVLPVSADVPDQTDPSRLVSLVRGFAMQARRFDNKRNYATNTGTLAGNFTSAVLNTFHGVGGARNALYRLPCENCQSLLQPFDIPVGQDNYYADLWEIDAAQAPLVN